MRLIESPTNKTPIEAPQDLGPAPALEWLPVDRLRLDDSHQRPLLKSNWNAIRKIAENFQWSRFQPIVVSPIEGGRFAVVDGQHRAHAAKLVGVESVPAMSCHLNRSEQASAFAWINGNTTAITQFHVYKAALAAGEGWASQCRDTVEGAGCRLMTSNRSTNTKRAGEIYAISMIRKHIDAGEADVVAAGLRALRRSANNDDPFLYSAAILKPWLGSLRASPKYLKLNLVAILDKHDLSAIMDDCDLQKKQPGYRHLSRYSLMSDRIGEILKQNQIDGVFGSAL